jgi:hypothetical protein
MWEDVHAVDAAVGEEVQHSDVSGEGVQLEPVRHVVPVPARVEFYLLPRHGVLLAAFLRYNTRNGKTSIELFRFRFLPSLKKKGKFFCPTIFCSHRYHTIVNNFNLWTGKENFFSQNTKNYFTGTLLFTQKFVFKGRLVTKN